MNPTVKIGSLELERAAVDVSVVVLNWNELEVVKDTVRRLLKEPGNIEIIVVDNGSTDGTREYFENLKVTQGQRVNALGFCYLPENCGASIARNIGIKASIGKYIFLIDGDILYVPGTIAEYVKILEKYPDAACVGQNSCELIAQLGHNGAYEPHQADARMDEDYTISDWFPMAWTQYGLFRASFLKEHPFVEVPPFNQAGYGFEDDWMYHEIKEAGLVSLSVDKPIYYHYAHSGIRELTKDGIDYEKNMLERKAVFEKRWGKKSGWADTLQKTGHGNSTRPKPE